MQDSTIQDTDNADSGGGLPENSAPAKPAKPVKVVGLRPTTKAEIAADNQCYRRLVKRGYDYIKECIAFGERMLKRQAQVEPKKWESFVEENYEFSSRTIRRFTNAAKNKHKFVHLSPEEFMVLFWGHKPPPKELKDNQEDTEDETDASVRSGGDSEGQDEGEKDSSKGEETKFGRFPKEEREDIVLFLEFQRMLNTYLEQPIAESAKLTTLEDLFSSIYAKLTSQAKKCNQPIEEIFKRLGF